ncbi:MAG: TSUP family transporter [Thermoanaerobaculia bacterium]|nr:TSUP family transporter [Thermoanaerobaculia bacterium]
MDPLSLLLLAGAGFAAGTLNVIAGGGSFLTLPVLIFLGLPPGVANGTNRIGILLQNVGAVWSFDRSGVLDRRSLLLTALPATLGAAAGTAAALVVGDDAFRRILAAVMVLASLASIWRPTAGGEAGNASLDRGHPRALLLAAAFFGVGVYGGFIQAGVGFLILGATSLGGLDLVRGNAVKVFAVLCFTTLSLALFALGGRVAWAPGLALAAGTVCGGLLGARLTVLRGHRWVRAVVTLMVIVFAVKLWLDG